MSVVGRWLRPHVRVIVARSSGRWADGFIALAGDAVPRLVYLERVRAPWASDAQFVKTLAEAARIVGTIQVAGVAALYEVGVVEGAPWLTWELVRGRSLAQVLGHAGRAAPLGVALGAIADGARALQRARVAAGCAHGCVTSRRLMLQRDGAVCWLRFAMPVPEPRDMLVADDARAVHRVMRACVARIGAPAARAILEPLLEDPTEQSLSALADAIDAATARASLDGSRETRSSWLEQAFGAALDAEDVAWERAARAPIEHAP